MGWGWLRLLIRGTNAECLICYVRVCACFEGETSSLGTHYIEGGPLGLEHTDRPTSCHEILRDHPVGCSLNYKIHANMRDTLLKSLAVSSVYSI